MTDSQPVSLQRSLGFWALVVYGVGDILGAGIYALVGKIAGVAGSSAWLAFAVALAAAALTALTYAELGSRFPKSGGEAYFCQRAFGRPVVSFTAGWLVFCSGVVSMATVSHAFAGYLLDAFGGASALWNYVVIAAFLMAISAINFSGMQFSSSTNIVCTAIEATGLLIVIALGVWFLVEGDVVAAGDVAQANAAEKAPPMDGGEVGAWYIVLQGAALAFFAFIGFEDMVNVSQEVQSPRRTVPLAIIIALAAAGAVYIAVVGVATAVVPPAELAASDAPLLEVVRRAAPRFPVWLFTAIAMFAVANTGLLNGIMGSRLLFGMSEQRLLPAVLRRVHPRTHTPHWAIIAILVAATLLAVSGTLVYLAGTTSVLLLIVFAAVNVSLIVVKRRRTPHPGEFHVPIIVPMLGATCSLALVAFLPPASLITAASMIAIGVLLAQFRKLSVDVA